MGEGTVRSWVQYSDDQPVAVGVRISEHGLHGLPTHGDHEGNEYVLRFPEEARDVPFTHVGINWNPAGHDPEHVYTVPHFDFHFYTITEEERDQIVLEDPAYEIKMAREPEQHFIPAGYFNTHDGIPRMGQHWANSAAPELNGQPFTHTFIFGSYDGRLIFFEPMITTEFLSRKVEAREAIAQPERIEQEGHYPTEYSIRWDDQAREYVIGLDKMKRVG